MMKLLITLFVALTTLNFTYAQDWPPPESVVLDTAVYDSILYQSPARIALEAGIAVRFSTSADVYLKWAAIPGASGYTVRYKLDLENVGWTTLQRSTNELILENIPLDVRLLWDVSVTGITSEALTYQSDAGVVSTYPQGEPIQVSHKLYNKLEGWFAKDDNPQGFCEFFRGLDVHRYEKLAFLQAYAFDNARFIKPLSPNANTDIRDWYPTNIATGTGTGDECIPILGNCKCKVISDGSNLATPNGGRDAVKRKIFPRFVQKIAKSGKRNTTIDRFEAGAAKYVALRQSEGIGGMTYTMSNLQGANDETSVTSEASELLFFLACIKKNGGVTTNLPAACQCSRPLYIDYEYTTKLFVKADKGFCPFSKGAESQAEDLAFVGVYEGKTGNIKPVAANHAMLTRSCSSSWNPEFWIKTLDLLKPVGEYYLQTLDTTQTKIPTKDQLMQFIDGLAGLIKTPIVNKSGECGEQPKDNLLVSGKANFELRPNAPIRVGMFSSYYLRTRGYGCWRAQAGIASDYFLLGVVESQLNEDDEECCSDKFGNYVLGSLSTPSNGDVPVEAVNSVENRMEDVGFFLSQYGSWDSLTRDPSSGVLLINHEYDLLRGPSCTPIQQRPGNGTAARASAKTVEPDEIKIYPSITEDYLNVDLFAQIPSYAQISLLDLSGGVSKMLFSGNLEQGGRTFQFSVHDVAKGTYIMHCRLGEQDYSFKVSIL